MPDTTRPPGPALTIPAVVVPSPQAMLALKSVGDSASGLRKRASASNGMPTCPGPKIVADGGGVSSTTQNATEVAPSTKIDVPCGHAVAAMAAIPPT